MEFSFTTKYDQRALAAMARALRKTVRKKHNKRSHIWGWIVVALGLLLTLPIGGERLEITFKTVVTWAAMAVIVLVLIKEDAINGYIARKRGLPQLTTANTVFSETNYSSETEMGTTEFNYENIIELAETKEYIVFIFSKSHAQVYDKSSLTGGTVEEFRTFIQNKTGHTIKTIS